MTVIIMAGLYLLLGFTALMIFGSAGLAALGVVSLIGLLFSGRYNNPALVVKQTGAYKLSPAAYHGVYQLTAHLAKRAGLVNAPRLYALPSSQLNAFAVGNREESAIVLSEGMLYTLTPREINAILGHEIAHLKNGDLHVIALADTVTRLVHSLSLIGQIAMVGAVLLFGFHISLFWFFLVAMLPTASVLLQLALSRTREFEADRTSGELTGDPASLAGALRKIDSIYKLSWKKLLVPGWFLNQPPLLRTHPPSEERISRLLELAGSISHNNTAWPYNGSRAIYHTLFGAGYHR